MERICQKCGKELQPNDFLCPECGAIYGDISVASAPKPAESSAATQTAEQPTGKTQTTPDRKKNLFFPAAVLSMVMMALVLFLPAFFGEEPAPGTTGLASTQPTQSQPPSTQITQPPTQSGHLFGPEWEKELLASYGQKYGDGKLDVSNVRVRAFWHVQLGQEFSTVALLINLNDAYAHGGVEYVDGFVFHYAPGTRLVVVHNGQTYSLHDGFESNIPVINNSVKLELLYRQHCMENSELYRPSETEHPLPELTEDQKRYVQGLLESVSVTDTPRVYYYAADCVVLGVPILYDGQYTKVEAQKVENLVFLTCGEALGVYVDGEFQSVSEAYEKGVLTYDQLVELFEVYRDSHLMLYYDSAMIPAERRDAQIIQDIVWRIFHGEMNISALSLEHYGTYGDAHVVFLQPTEATYTANNMILLGNHILFYPTSQMPFLYINGLLVHPSLALEENLLDESSIEILYEQHVWCHPEYYMPPQTNLKMPYAEDSVLQKIRRDYYAYTSAPEGNSMDDVQITIYGRYGDAYIGIFSAPWMLWSEPEGPNGAWLNQYWFQYHHENALQVYLDGNFYPLEDLLSLTEVNLSEVEELFMLYLQENLELYYPADKLPESDTKKQILSQLNQQYYGGLLDQSQLTFRSYGIYQDAWVFMIDGADVYENRHTQEYASIVFCYATTQKLTVWKEGIFYSLQQALENRILSEADIAHIYNQHMQAYPAMYQPPLPTTRLPSMEQEQLEQLQREFSKKGWQLSPGGQLGNVHLRYYGQFSDAQVFLAWNLDQYVSGTTKYAQVGQLLFPYAAGTELIVYADRRFLPLSKAYQENVISQDALYQIHQLYCQQKWELYYPDSSRVVDWNQVDWTTIDPSILGSDTWQSWVNWINFEATLEQLIQVCYIQPDAAYAASYNWRLGEWFVTDPVYFISVIADMDAHLHTTVQQSVLFSEYFEANGFSKRDVILSIRLPEDASDQEQAVVQLFVDAIAAMEYPT